MKLSLNIGKISGIKIVVHWTFLLLIAWVFFGEMRDGKGWEAGMMRVAFILAVFVSVVLHELGHALTARWFGCKTTSILLLPIGGVAQMERLPEKPIQEMVMAIAGPLVNVLIATVLGIFLALSMQSFHVSDMLQTNEVTGSNFLLMLMTVNIGLAVFNLIPAFPMDGGRVLRALLATRMNRIKATQVAARIGQGLALVFVIVGMLSNIWLVFIGLFIFLIAGAEAAFEEEKSMLLTHQVNDVIMHNFTLLKRNDTLADAVNVLLNGQETDFVVVDNGRACGIITQKEIIFGLSEVGKNALVGEMMNKHFLSLHSTMNLKNVYMKMRTQNLSICPVEADGKIIGVLSMGNIQELLLVEKTGFATHVHPRGLVSEN